MNKILRKETGDLKNYLKSRGIMSDYYEYMSNLSSRETEAEEDYNEK